MNSESHHLSSSTLSIEPAILTEKSSPLVDEASNTPPEGTTSGAVEENPQEAQPSETAPPKSPANLPIQSAVAEKNSPDKVSQHKEALKEEKFEEKEITVEEQPKSHEELKVERSEEDSKVETVEQPKLEGSEVSKVDKIQESQIETVEKQTLEEIKETKAGVVEAEEVKDEKVEQEVNVENPALSPIQDKHSEVSVTPDAILPAVDSPKKESSPKHEEEVAVESTAVKSVNSVQPEEVEMAEIQEENIKNQLHEIIKEIDKEVGKEEVKILYFGKFIFI